MRLALCLLLLALTGCGGDYAGADQPTGMIKIVNISDKIEAMGGLPKSVYVRGISADGAVIVGEYRGKKPPYNWQIFRYDQNRGMVSFGGYEKDGDRIGRVCLSADGKVMYVTIFTNNHKHKVIRHSYGDGARDITELFSENVVVEGTSYDGSIVVGEFLKIENNSRDGHGHAFIYSREKGFEDIGALGANHATARSVSRDGNFIVGNINLEDRSSRAFIFSRKTGPREIWAESRAAFAYATSDDGSVIAGTYFGGFNLLSYGYDSAVFIHTAKGGTKKLGAMQGKSAHVHSISADGSRFNGSYKDYFGNTYAYIAPVYGAQ